MTKTSDIERLFKANYTAMHRIAMLMLRDEDVARDIVHDVFEALMIAGLAEVSSRYLLKAVRNRCLNYLRGLSVCERVKELYALDEQTLAQRYDNRMDCAGEDWPDEETLAIIRLAVDNNLTEACRRVVNLRFSEGKSYKEIAGQLNISEVAVYKHLRHAVDVIRLKLSENG